MDRRFLSPPRFALARAALFLTIAALWACTPDAKNSGNGDGDTDAGKVRPDAGPIPLDTAKWTLEPVAPSPATISHTPSLDFTASGTPWLSYTDAASDLSGENIFTVKMTSGQTAQARTHDSNLENAWNMVRADGETVNLVFSSFEDGDSDVYLSQNVGGTWSSNKNLTTAVDDVGTPRWEYAPAIAIGPGGARAIAYLSSTGSSDYSPEVRLIRLKPNNDLDGPPVTVIPSDTGGCSAPQVAFQSSGSIHVVASCGSLAMGALIHAYQSGNSWTHATLYASDSVTDMSPVLRTSMDGSSVYLAWTRLEACGDDSCGRIMLGNLKGAVAGTPVHATTSGDYYWPALGVDPFGRLLLLFHGQTDNYFELWFTFSENSGASFAPPKDLTPGNKNKNLDDWDAGDWAFDADGRPHFVSVRIYDGSDPTNTDIIHGYVK